MKKRVVSLITALLICVSMMGFTVSAASPSISAQLLDGKMTVSVTGLSSDIAQVMVLATSTADSSDYYLYTASSANETADGTFKITFPVSGSEYTLSATPINSDGVSQSPINYAGTLKASTITGVTYSIYEKYWQTASNNNNVGHANRGLRVEALNIKLTGNLPAGAKINYSIFENGWQTNFNGLNIGNANRGRRVEALKVWLTGVTGYKVTYSIYENRSWQTASDGAPVGHANRGYYVEALRINVTKI